ncbi:hypothetical protein RJ640_026569 [Escallonia rubra]|uniref:Uncharacterized protein n=1 Tax=Escallonia rubra TaxID=112253 RepID=A0AA88S4B8_9ASTE|nr:hypothetical protein RJ640_026569 [Escallonia rubra]
MPGVGKTTMMEEIRRALVLNKEFEEVAVAVVSATLDVKSIQRKLASGLGLSDLDKEADESTRAGLLRRRLKNGKKILIILDDVWCKLPLADIGIDFGDSKNCKIFMTSRERRVCEANKCMSFLIDILSKEEAWSLFRQHAGNCVDYPDISPVSEVVFNECGRLPLIIRAVGEALKDGDLFEWKDAQRQFESCTPHMIANIDDQAYKTLELSFNKLKPEEAKSCLLLCSLFPEDAAISIDEVSLLAKAMGFLPNTDSIEDARNRALSLAKTLKTSCLLQECEDGDSVKLHDVIRDVSVHVASEDVKYRFMVKSVVSAWPEIHEARRAISLRIETTLELPRKLECPQLQTLMLNSNKYACTRVPDTFFDGLENLAGLNVRELHVPLLSRMSTFSISRLPELQLLWNRDPCGILDFQSLTVIKIEHCGLLKMLFSCSVARALEQLRVLIVGSCPMIETIVYDDEGKEGTGHSIEFPRLKFIKLEELPRLTSFCNAKIALTMYSLTASRLDRCPRILGFSSGQLHMPKMKISSGQLATQLRMTYLGRAPSPWITVTDLNKQLQELVTDKDSSRNWVKTDVVDNFLEELAWNDRYEIQKYKIFNELYPTTSIFLIRQSSMIGSSK